jgi:hypothetical protein
MPLEQTRATRPKKTRRAERVLHLVGMDERGKIGRRKRCRRGEVLPYMSQFPFGGHSGYDPPSVLSGDKREANNGGEFQGCHFPKLATEPREEITCDTGTFVEVY